MNSTYFLPARAASFRLGFLFSIHPIARAWPLAGAVYLWFCLPIPGGGMGYPVEPCGHMAHLSGEVSFAKGGAATGNAKESCIKQ